MVKILSSIEVVSCNLFPSLVDESHIPQARLACVHVVCREVLFKTAADDVIGDRLFEIELVLLFDSFGTPSWRLCVHGRVNWHTDKYFNLLMISHSSI